jgi:hypothetical protein
MQNESKLKNARAALREAVAWFRAGRFDLATVAAREANALLLRAETQRKATTAAT